MLEPNLRQLALVSGTLPLDPYSHALRVIGRCGSQADHSHHRVLTQNLRGRHALVCGGCHIQPCPAHKQGGSSQPSEVLIFLPIDQQLKGATCWAPAAPTVPLMRPVPAAQRSAHPQQQLVLPLAQQQAPVAQPLRLRRAAAQPQRAQLLHVHQAVAGPTRDRTGAAAGRRIPCRCLG